MEQLRVHTALGDFLIVATGRGLRSITPLRAHETGSGSTQPATGQGGSAGEDSLRHAHVHAHAAADALCRYVAGERVRYDGPLDVQGSALQRAVWDRLRAIPFGATIRYGEIASALDMVGEARAIGAAVAANPVCILVPCHRVVAADGSLRGFAWGLDLKRRLLAHEGSAALELFGNVRGG